MDNQMTEDERTVKLLEEIRDASREHLAEYRRVTERSLSLQEQAVVRQAEIGALYKRIVRFALTVIFVLVLLLAYLLIKWGPRLFR
jgi:type VI protein secretion system component VasF